MATKRELVEAHSFSRRRLVTAFVSGAPGGREVEPTRPGRTIIGGVALSVLLLAGGAIAGVFSPRTPADWMQPGLVLSKDTGAPYVVIDNAAGEPVLRPVVNITSARLLLGADASPTTVAQDEIDKQELGDYIGIAEAPATLPSSERMIDDGWTACVDSDTGIDLTLSPRPGVTELDGAAFVVDVGDDSYLVARARRSRTDGQSFSYQLPAEPATRSSLLRALGLGESFDARAVGRDWLALFPASDPLRQASFDLPGKGGPISYGRALGGLDAEVGDLVTVGGDQVFLLQQDGPASLDRFALAVYRETARPAEHETDQLGVETVPPAHSADWPDTTLEPVFTPYCALLHPGDAAPPVVRLATTADPSAVVSVPAGQRSVSMAAGRGAYYVVGGWESSDGRARFVVDPKGDRHVLDGAAHELLGYADHNPRVVPDSWSDLFYDGVVLSRDAALCGPTPRANTPCE
ncbi:type VII secretion protein EccB [Nocardioides sp.]|uniref:type VII secretion protein EccB n=1 Tax=Nocardioides sp. TaxID=35761 RepID=UPI00273252D3|nr:type VII secretion protein EccB [Nocardioides sp.]MDP3893426.1 type VII secretion protein EccB [Nocardioides sp.]